MPNPRDGQWDAFRHAYWNALNARDLGEKESAFFSTLHELGENPANNPRSSEYDPVAIEMDLFNNDVGRKIGSANPNASDEELADKVMDALRSGELKVVKFGTVTDPGTGMPVQVPINSSGQPIKNNQEKILENSAPVKVNSGATTPEKGYNNKDKKSKEYDASDMLPKG